MWGTVLERTRGRDKRRWFPGGLGRRVVVLGRITRDIVPRLILRLKVRIVWISGVRQREKVLGGVGGEAVDGTFLDKSVIWIL
jgi:hypothetical protein